MIDPNKLEIDVEHYISNGDTQPFFDTVADFMADNGKHRAARDIRGIPDADEYNEESYREIEEEKEEFEEKYEELKSFCHNLVAELMQARDKEDFIEAMHTFLGDSPTELKSETMTKVREIVGEDDDDDGLANIIALNLSPAQRKAVEALYDDGQSFSKIHGKTMNGLKKLKVWDNGLTPIGNKVGEIVAAA